MLNWKEAELGDIADVQTGPFGSQLKNEQYITGGTPVVTVEHIKDFRITDFDYPSITDEDKGRLSKYLMQTDDILFTRVGSVDLSAYVSERQNGWMFSSRMLRVRPNEEINSRFLSYYFQQKSFRDYILNISVGATMPSINTEILKGIPISYPPLPEQTAITSVLSSLDDKIDLLHRQNTTLEKMAETLFRQWFVEEAKEEWGTLPLSKVANFLNGLACQKFLPKNEIDKLPVLKIKELSSGITENSDWASTDIKTEYIVRNGDIIFAWSASLMVKIWDGQDCILNQHLFKVTSENYPKWFYYLWCKHHLAEFISIAASHATTMGHIKRRDLDEAIVLIPSNEELKLMSQQVEPIIEKVITNNNQIHTLTALRDTLLPKLMSGEVRVEHENKVNNRNE
ncbi:restriction endonuclease subunit S [Shivajiella indica]|uniref:Restriction endonuclease subunit S n=1 Tax=Shivajiella indica TaxID=872115 RepID=A0ABW5BC03_9BACT